MLNEKSRLHEVYINIHKLGAICDSKISLNQLMLFSGESGVGKSYLAILSNYIFQLMASPSRLDAIIKQKVEPFYERRKSFGKSGTAYIINKSDFLNWINEDAISYLKYILNDQTVSADFTFSIPFPDQINITYQEMNDGLEESPNSFLLLNINDTLTYRVTGNNESIDDESPISFLIRYYIINLLMGNYKNFQYNYILPPSRGAVLTEDVRPLSGLFQEFKTQLNNVYASQSDNYTPDDFLLKEFNTILDGDLKKNPDSNVYSYITHGKTLNLSASASSIREMAPLFLFISKKNVSLSSIFIEEPEAHLHPLKQRMMGDVISLLLHSNACVQITTHSDYLLHRLDELIMLYKVYQSHLEDKLSHINIKIPSSLQLDFHKVNAYLLKRDKDGNVKVELQNLNGHGDIFASFYEALRLNLDTGQQLINILDNSDNEDN